MESLETHFVGPDFLLFFSDHQGKRPKNDSPMFQPAWRHPANSGIIRQENSAGLARIFHSHSGKSREKPYEKRGANTCECVVEKTRHAGLETCDTAGWEACATTLECRCVSRRIVARLQRLMAIMASKPRALPWAVMWRPFRPCIRTAILEEESYGISIDGTAQGLRYGRLGSLRYKGLPWFCRFHYEISGLGPDFYRSRPGGNALQKAATGRQPVAALAS